MGIENIKNKKVGYIRVSQSIPLTQSGSVTIGGFTQRMAILRLLNDAGCDITILSDIRKEDEAEAKRRGWHYKPVQLDLGDEYEVLVVENAATHNLFFSSRPELKHLPLVQVQDHRIASFKGSKVYWQCLDPIIVRSNWSSEEDQIRIGNMTTVWHGALKPEAYVKQLSNRSLIFNKAKEWKFFSAQRFNEFLPINPISRRKYKLTYIGSQRPRTNVFKDIYYSPTLANYDVNIVGRTWKNELVNAAPPNVKFWGPIPQWDAPWMLNWTVATVVIGDRIYENSSWWTTRQLEAIYGNCILMVSDRYEDPINHVMDERLIVNGSSVGEAMKWILDQDFSKLIRRQREYFMDKWYVQPEDEYEMF